MILTFWKKSEKISLKWRSLPERDTLKVHWYHKAKNTKIKYSIYIKTIDSEYVECILNCGLSSKDDRMKNKEKVNWNA
jgi:hypothetical protein